MKRGLIFAAAALAVGLGVTLAGGGGRPFTTVLSGEQEIPGPGDPDGSGSARLAINPGIGEICYELTVSDVEDVTAAHIHRAPPDSAGPVVVPLDAPADGSSEGCITVDRELALDILKNPESYYVNVHSQNHPAGAVRGQLSR
jgi:hypothetical protein